jgi:hypothetical protein
MPSSMSTTIDWSLRAKLDGRLRLQRRPAENAVAEMYVRLLRWEIDHADG